MSENVYLITRMENRICSFLMQDGRATEIHRDSDETDKIMLGDIYIGKVKNIAKQLDAAFVEIAPGHVCYLAMKDLRTHSDETDKIMLGDIYIGKVKNIAKQLDAAFVEIAPGHVCYLAMKDLRTLIYTKKGSSKKLQAGDELLVQISRESIKSKYPSVTTNVTLHGKYVLLTFRPGTNCLFRSAEKA